MSYIDLCVLCWKPFGGSVFNDILFSLKWFSFNLKILYGIIYRWMYQINAWNLSDWLNINGFSLKVEKPI